MRRILVLTVFLGLIVPVRAQRPVISTRPDTPFKLATFDASGRVRVGLVRSLDTAEGVERLDHRDVLVAYAAERGEPAPIPLAGEPASS